MFQSAGSIAVKTALLFADKNIKQKKLDCNQIIFYHDEVEYEVLEEHSELAKQIVEAAFPAASKFFSMNVPLVGEGKIGKSWLDVH